MFFHGVNKYVVNVTKIKNNKKFVNVIISMILYIVY